MEKYYLAIDLGASSGRHILCHLEDRKMVLEEVHRFENGFTEKDGHLVWDVDALFREILTGLRKCREIGKIPGTVGVDTWGVDFVLLDDGGDRLGDAVAYRDHRTSGMDEELYKIVPEDELYHRTGIQKNIINTVYHLMALKKESPELLEQASDFLMMPDYFHYRLTGKRAAEYTNTTTTQLNDPKTGNWNFDLLERLGLPARIFPKICFPGTSLGRVTEEVEKEIGYAPEVILPGTHDTASAVLAVPALHDTVYISSGTWSLMGIEREEADTSEESRIRNFTNEGGYDRRFRYLKNIMGLWMIQSVRKELREQGEGYSYDELCRMAEGERIASLVDCSDEAFLAPDSMIGAIQSACRESGQTVPKTAGELAAVVYNSLAYCYRDTVREIEEITGKHYDCINIVGGGSNAEYLNRITARVTGRTVYAGPSEATAIGNVLVQMLRDGTFRDIREARRAVFDSFGVKTYEP